MSIETSFDQLDLVAIGVGDEGDHGRAALDRPASRVTLPPPARMRSQASAAFGTPIAMWP